MTSALSRLDAVKDVLTVKRVFGDAYEVDGVTVIPVAAVRGRRGRGWRRRCARRPGNRFR